MIDIQLLPDDVAESAAKNMGYDLGDENGYLKFAKWLETATVEQVFDRYLAWKGLLGGWARTLIPALDGIRAAERTTKEAEDGGWR
jgi:hypothetical protein